LIEEVNKRQRQLQRGRKRSGSLPFPINTKIVFAKNLSRLNELRVAAALTEPRQKLEPHLREKGNEWKIHAEF